MFVHALGACVGRPDAGLGPATCWDPPPPEGSAPKRSSIVLRLTQQRCDKHTPGNKPTVIQAAN